MKLPTKTVEYEVTVKKTKEVTDWSAFKQMVMPFVFLAALAAFVAYLGYYMHSALLLAGTFVLLLLGNLGRSIWAKWYIKLIGFVLLIGAVIYVGYYLGDTVPFPTP